MSIDITKCCKPGCHDIAVVDSAVQRIANSERPLAYGYCRAHLRESKWQELRPPEYLFGCPACGNDYAEAVIIFQAPYADDTYQLLEDIHIGDYEVDDGNLYANLEWEYVLGNAITELENSNHPLLDHPDIEEYEYGTLFDPSSRPLLDALTEGSHIDRTTCTNCGHHIHVDWV